jgi:hypothetical protein
VAKGSFTLTCPANYKVPADGVHRGATVDLTKDLLNGNVVDSCGGVDGISISDPLPANAAQLSPGRNVITVAAGSVATCTYVVEVSPVGACCGAPNVGCIDGVVLADCPEGGFWVADTKCSEDCGNLFELDHCDKSHSLNHCFVGSCCRAGGCKITPKAKCDPKRFVVGEHTCKHDCGACCGGNVDDRCQDDYTRRQCNADNGQFKESGVCHRDCGKCFVL